MANSLKKPIRLDLAKERRDANGHLRQKSVWNIRDGEKKISTGCGPEDREGAESKLREYLAQQHSMKRPGKKKAAHETSCADVIAHYANVSAREPVARPKELAARLERLLEFWGGMTLDEVDEFNCDAYAISRKSNSAARRELEDFRAAIRLHNRHGLCRDHVTVTLPGKSQPRKSYLTRDQIAALIWHCWTFRRSQYGKPTADRPMRHLVPFILAAVYTGTRSRRVWRASFIREEGRPWVDLEGGVYYREAQGEAAPDNKRAAAIRIPGRLLAHMKRWHRGPLVDGERKPRRYLVEHQGHAADPKLALGRAMDTVYGEGHPYVRHTFRHTCATWLLWAGADVGDIASYMSMTREMVVSVYGKEHPDADKDVGEAFTKGKAGRRRGATQDTRGTAKRAERKADDDPEGDVPE